MKKEVFAARLREAAEKSRGFARRYLEEELPDEMRFRLRLSSSYDGNPLHEDERVFPEDGSSERAAQVQSLTADEVVAELWRDGAVPEWLDVSVMGLLDDATLMEILCCGRFTSNDEILYHQHAGLPPFSIKSPAFPPRYEDGDRFSIYHRSTCWTREELARISEHAPKVWSLDLHGSAFDDETLARLPVFDGLHILCLHASPLRGPGLAGLARQSWLGVLRVNAEAATLSLDSLPKLKHLGTLDLTNLSDRPIDLSWVWKRAKRVSWLVLDGRELVLENRWRRSLGYMTLRASKLHGDPLPKRLGSLQLHLPNADDDEVDRLLRGVKSVDRLSLRGTPVTDDLIESLVARFEPQSLDVYKTRVSEDLFGVWVGGIPSFGSRRRSTWKLATGSSAGTTVDDCAHSGQVSTLIPSDFRGRDGRRLRRGSTRYGTTEMGRVRSVPTGAPSPPVLRPHRCSVPTTAKRKRPHPMGAAVSR